MPMGWQGVLGFIDCQVCVAKEPRTVKLGSFPNETCQCKESSKCCHHMYHRAKPTEQHCVWSIKRRKIGFLVVVASCGGGNGEACSNLCTRIFLKLKRTGWGKSSGCRIVTGHFQ